MTGFLLYVASRTATYTPPKADHTPVWLTVFLMSKTQLNKIVPANWWIMSIFQFAIGALKLKF